MPTSPKVGAARALNALEVHTLNVRAFIEAREVPR